jgi:hypothetical protein
MFYHYPREELIADGKVPWREFVWHYGQPDGEIDEDEFRPITRYCGLQTEPQWCHHDDDDNDRNQKRSRSRDLMGRVTSWLDGCGRPKNRAVEGRGSGGYAGGSSRRRRVPLHDVSPPPCRGGSPPDEKRAFRELWQARGSFIEEETNVGLQQHMLEPSHSDPPTYRSEEFSAHSCAFHSDAIVITPLQHYEGVPEPSHVKHTTHQCTDAIEIVPQP